MAKQIVLPFFTLINGQSIAFDKQIIWNKKYKSIHTTEFDCQI